MWLTLKILQQLKHKDQGTTLVKLLGKDNYPQVDPKTETAREV